MGGDSVHRWPKQGDLIRLPRSDIDPIVTDRKSAIAREAGRQFAQVAKDYGFVTVRNHGIDAELISKVVQQADLFFNTDQDYRNQFIVDNEDYGKGYWIGDFDSSSVVIQETCRSR